MKIKKFGEMKSRDKLKYIPLFGMLWGVPFFKNETELYSGEFTQNLKYSWQHFVCVLYHIFSLFFVMMTLMTLIIIILRHFQN